TLQGTGPLGGRVGGRNELWLDLGRRPKGRVVQRREILFHCPARRCGIEFFLPLYARDRALTVGVGFDQARIDGEALPSDQTGCDKRVEDTVEYTPKNSGLTETLVASTREGRVVGDGVFQT